MNRSLVMLKKRLLATGLTATGLAATGMAATGLAVAAFAVTAMSDPAGPQEHPAAAPAAEVYFISPRAGAVLHSPFVVRFGVKGMGVAPAGIHFDGTGHHHLLVDTDLSEVKLDAPLPVSDKIRHFGKGQTETELTLPPGKHTLELLFADYQHVPFDPPLHSKKITITVEQ